MKLPLPIVLLTCVLLLTFSSVVLGESNPVIKDSSVAIPIGQEVIAPADKILITIWRKPDHSEIELDGNFAVDKDGFVNLSTIGQIKAAGLSIPQLKEELIKQAGRFLKSPEVAVSPAKIQDSEPGVFSKKEEIDKLVAEQSRDRRKQMARDRDDIVEAQEGYDIGIKKNKSRTAKVKPNVVRYTSILEERKPAEYTINIDDVLDVTVWQNPELSKEVTVRSDGRITLLLAGDVQAAGLTTTQLKDEIAKKLGTYVINPQVAVTLKKFGGKRIVVLGEVRQPGTYKLDANARLMEAIGMAEGFTDKSFTGSVLLARADSYGNPRIFIIDTYDIMGRGRVDKNIILQQFDVVYVPRTKIWNVVNLLKPFADLIAEVKTASNNSQMMFVE
ncbi:MAG: polysaccharide biosynthesis/export family protein [Candidatus Omnitrophica bacterium]|nr:polysaccharide biosynthesis/export family protein [Candidatus Omnitrophota bacterium]